MWKKEEKTNYKKKHLVVHCLQSETNWMQAIYDKCDAFLPKAVKWSTNCNSDKTINKTEQMVAIKVILILAFVFSTRKYYLDYKYDKKSKLSQRIWFCKLFQDFFFIFCFSFENYGKF